MDCSPHRVDTHRDLVVLLPERGVLSNRPVRMGSQLGFKSSVRGRWDRPWSTGTGARGQRPGLLPTCNVEFDGRERDVESPCCFRLGHAGVHHSDDPLAEILGVSFHALSILPAESLILLL
jgi:hypothetical protein